jgi:signal transduction histidine kinase
MGIDAAVPFFALWFYNHQNLYLPCLPPLLALNSIVFFCLVSDFTFERLEKGRLRSTLQTRDDLTHMIIHDLRSPLSLVTGYVDVLEQMASEKLNPDEAECVTGAKRGADDMSDMITTVGSRQVKCHSAYKITTSRRSRATLRIDLPPSCEVALFGARYNASQWQSLAMPMSSGGFLRTSSAMR